MSRLTKERKHEIAYSLVKIYLHKVIDEYENEVGGKGIIRCRERDLRKIGLSQFSLDGYDSTIFLKEIISEIDDENSRYNKNERR